MEKRRHERYTESLEIKVTWPGKGTLTGNTRDFSDGGTFIKINFNPEPPLNTEMMLQLNSMVGDSEAPILVARVVRVTDEGTAFEFIFS